MWPNSKVHTLGACSILGTDCNNNHNFCFVLGPQLEVHRDSEAAPDGTKGAMCSVGIQSRIRAIAAC